jgi:tetratricopeptide (TPR) repeat protein
MLKSSSTQDAEEKHSEPIPSDETAADASSPYSRQRVLLISVLLLLVLFGITAFVSRQYHRKVHTLADRWFAEGERRFQSGDVAGALGDYRYALVYSPDNSVFQLHLAQALAAVGRVDEARSYLTNLLAESPGSAAINLELARIAARQGATAEALRYYHGAVYGVWEKDPLDMRWRVRRELCKYLLDSGAKAQAVPEAIALADETAPEDSERRKNAASLLLRAGVSSRALTEFQSVLSVDRHDTVALTGAGTAAFRMGQYELTIDYLSRLPREKRSEPAIVKMLATSRQVEAADPFRPSLSIAAKARRTANALAQSDSRLAACARQLGQSLVTTAPTTQLQQLHAQRQKMKRDWSTVNLRRYPNRIEPAMSLVFQMEDAAAQQCGTPQEGADYVLMLIARNRGGGIQ